MNTTHAPQGTETGAGSGARVGIVGTGMLGSAVAVRLAQRGCRVSVYNRTAQKTGGAEAAGATVLGSPRQVAEASEVIIMVVKDAEAVRDVSFGGSGGDGGQGIVHGCRPGGQVVADMSTIGPASSAEITSEYKRRGITKIDSPVMGGPDAAAAGRLIAMASGSGQGFAACRKILDHVSEKVVYLGPEPGTANAVKLAMNMQITMLALSLAEGITLVREAGVDPREFLDVLNATYFSTGMSRKKAYNMIDESQSPTFTLANLRKDIHIMTDVARSMGLSLPMISAAQKVYDGALEDGHGHMDYTGIIRHIRENGGAHERGGGGGGGDSNAEPPP